MSFLVKALALGAALSLVGQGATLAQSPFPRPTNAPSAYTGRPALAGAPTGQRALPPPALATEPTQTMRVDLGSGGGSATRMMSLPRGKSAVIELPIDARDVLVSDPKVADVVLSTPRRIYVLGVGAGQTDAVFFDGAGRQLLNLNIRVDQDITALSQTLARVLPGSSVHVESLNENLILSGQVANLAEADKAVQLARGLVAKPTQVINMLSIADPDQVMLKVRIVEVNRSVIKQLGFNTDLAFNSGLQSYSFGQSASFGVNGSQLGGATACGGQTGARTTNYNNSSSTTNSNGSGTVTDSASTAFSRIVGDNISACLAAFERVGLVRTLAEPNLTAVSGEAARFLAGGEFPVPAGRDNNGTVTIEFKPYGVGLGFAPVVLSRGRISLKVSTEYSEITNIGALSLSNGGSSTTTVPGLNVRRAETMVELPSGGSMMIAGLLQSTTKSTIDALPGITQLPVLGTLFRSRDFLNNQSELVVIVTPYLVKATSEDRLQTPADGLQIANDFQTVLLGRINRASSKAPAQGAAYQGPYGYVVD